MLLCNGCLYVHINKTGGTSVHRAILDSGTRCSYIAQIVKPEAPLREGANRYYGHYSPSDLLQQLGPAYRHLWVFTLVRNPWARYVSWYYWRRQFTEQSFEEWLKQALENPQPKTARTITRQSDYFDNPDCYDYVAKLENIREEWTAIRRRLGLTVPLAKHNVSRHPHYVVSYTDYLRGLVARQEKYIIDRFGYKFGEE